MEGIKFDEKNVRLHIAVKSWEEAIRAGAQILVDNGCVKPSYVEGIIASIKKYGPYIIISPGFAIPHTRAEDGAIKIGFSLITFQQPVYFEGDKEPVKVMICFSATDSSAHLDILKMIVEFVEKGYVDAIADVTTLDELLAVVKQQDRGKEEAL